MARGFVFRDERFTLNLCEKRPTNMFGFFFSILVVVALLRILGEIVIRVRLTRRAPRDKVAWWRCGGDEASATYEEVFPDSSLPFSRRFIF
jgi:hypothetical protein